MSNQSPLRRLSLDRPHVEQLRWYCSTYRDLLWQAQPTPERNREIRKVQAFQGRLSLPAGGSHLSLMLTAEEKQTVEQLLSALTHSSGAAPDSPHKIRTLTTLTAFRQMLQATSPRVLAHEEGQGNRMERDVAADE